MTWLREPGILEYILIGLFGLLYILYIVRIFLISRKLKSEFKTIFYKFFLRSGYFFLLIIALLGPSFGNVKKEIKSISKEIFFVIDISLSMDATDILPSRLEKTKQELKKTIRSLSSDKIGIIAFSSSAFIHCPPTYDQSALTIFIESLNTNISLAQGSDLSSGLELAIDQHAKNKNDGFTKVLVLITDGEDFSEKLMELSSDIKKNNIHLFILGIGTDRGSKIPFNGVYKKDPENREVITRLQAADLKEFADQAEGTYFEVTELQNEVEYLTHTLDKIEGSLSEVKEVDANANKYLYFLAFAFLLIIMDVLITVRTMRII